MPRIEIMPAVSLAIDRGTCAKGYSRCIARKSRLCSKVARDNEIRPIAIMARANSLGPNKRPLDAAALSASIWKNLYMLNPKVISDVAVRIHDIKVRSWDNRV